MLRLFIFLRTSRYGFYMLARLLLHYWFIGIAAKLKYPPGRGKQTDGINSFAGMG